VLADRSRVLQGVFYLRLAEEDVAATHAPQHPLEGGEPLSADHPGNKSGIRVMSSINDQCAHVTVKSNQAMDGLVTLIWGSLAWILQHYCPELDNESKYY